MCDSKFYILLWINCFFLNYKYLLINLLSLEFMMLGMFMYMYMYLIIMNYEMYFSMIFLVISVCAGVMGLSLMISMVRGYGNNYFQTMNFILC